jgi:hypothetical protein
MDVEAMVVCNHTTFPIRDGSAPGHLLMKSLQKHYFFAENNVHG